MYFTLIGETDSVYSGDFKGQGLWPAMTKSFKACLTHSLGRVRVCVTKKVLCILQGVFFTRKPF